jgi:AcrR family transcriptional regulator
MYVKKASQAQATRAKLEEVGQRLFAASGFAHVSAEELVAQAGVTRGALYHHYDGKAGLFEAVVEDTMRRLHERLAAAGSGARDPLAALARGISAFLELCAEPATERILLVDAPAVLGWPKWREMDARYGLGLLRGALSAAMQAGLLRAQDPDLLAHLLLGALTEAVMVVARAPDPDASRRAAERALDAMIDAWRVPQ